MEAWEWRVLVFFFQDFSIPPDLDVYSKASEQNWAGSLRSSEQAL